MVDSGRYERISKYIKEHEDDIIRDLFYICSMPSVRSDSENENEPFGHECAVCLEKTAELYKNNGFSVEIFEKSGYALASGANETGKKTVGLYAHTDVVPVNEAEWTVTKPFVPKRIGNCVFARGVGDNKNAVISSLYILKAIRNLGIDTNSRFQIFLGSNEESGMADIKRFVKEQPVPDVNIVPDAGFPAAIGQKGIWRFNVRSEKAFEDVVNVGGGSAYNIVLDKVTAKFKKKSGLLEEMLSKASENIKVEDGSFITVTVMGASAHAAEVWKGTNALWLLSKFLLSIETLSDKDKRIFAVVENSLSDVYGENLGIASKSDFFWETTCANGIVKTVNGCIEYTFDIRHTDVIEPDEMLSKVKSYFSDAGFVYNEYSHSLCMKRDENSMPIRTFMEGYRALTGDEEAKAYVMGGGTYANYLDGGFAIGVNVNGYKRDVELPEGRGNAHQADEVICVPAFLDGIALTAELLLEIDDNLI